MKVNRIKNQEDIFLDHIISWICVTFAVCINYGNLNLRSVFFQGFFFFFAKATAISYDSNQDILMVLCYLRKYMV